MPNLIPICQMGIKFGAGHYCFSLYLYFSRSLPTVPTTSLGGAGGVGKKFMPSVPEVGGGHCGSPFLSGRPTPHGTRMSDPRLVTNRSCRSTAVSRGARHLSQVTKATFPWGKSVTASGGIKVISTGLFKLPFQGLSDTHTLSCDLYSSRNYMC